MGTRDPRVDAYIAKSAEFARPILGHLRDLVHATCPQAEETLKWGMPHFMYQGLLCGMAAFKQHCTFGFWKGALILDKGGQRVDEAMGQFGRITAVSDLPAARTIAGYIKQAMRLNEDGVKAPAMTKTAQRKPPPSVPEDLAAALVLKKHAKARQVFEAFSPSQRREYCEWIAESKRADTRERRLAQTLEWLAEGKSRHWKYQA